MNEAMIAGTIQTARKVTGAIVGTQMLSASVVADAELVGDLSAAYTTQGEQYNGNYEVTPRVDGQELKTKHKYMIDDVTIHAIPYFEVSNTVGGTTVYIADEIEME